MAEQAYKGESRLGELNLSEQARPIRWHSQLIEDVERVEHGRFATVTLVTQNLWVLIQV